VPDARHIAVGPQGVVTFVSTRKAKVYAVTDRGKSGTADEVKQFAPTLGDLTIPDGVCFSRDGFLYVTQQNMIIEFPAAEFFYESPDVVANPIVPKGNLIVKSAESYNHTSRACTIGPDNKLYLTLGQPYNVTPKERLEEFAKWGIGGIVRMDRDGSNREVYARGVRNSVGLAFNPKDKTLWFTDNQVDGMGDDIPPGELNRATKMGLNFGFPWYGGGKVRTVEFKDETPPADVVFPQVEMVAHAADLGMSFYTGKMFPPKYQGAIFSAQHGSWNRTEPVGARVMVTTLKDDGTADKSEPFAEGWLDSDGEYLGRPVDVQQLRDGSLLVSDDFAGALYRITYSGR
jgi:glucose/arabinose dehydrogenase